MVLVQIQIERCASYGLTPLTNYLESRLAGNSARFRLRDNAEGGLRRFLLKELNRTSAYRLNVLVCHMNCLTIAQLSSSLLGKAGNGAAHVDPRMSYKSLSGGQRLSKTSIQ